MAGIDLESKGGETYAKLFTSPMARPIVELRLLTCPLSREIHVTPSFFRFIGGSKEPSCWDSGRICQTGGSMLAAGDILTNEVFYTEGCVQRTDPAVGYTKPQISGIDPSLIIK